MERLERGPLSSLRLIEHLAGSNQASEACDPSYFLFLIKQRERPPFERVDDLSALTNFSCCKSALFQCRLGLSIIDPFLGEGKTAAFRFCPFSEHAGHVQGADFSVTIVAPDHLDA